VGQIFGPIGYFFNEIFTYPIFNALMLLYHLFGDMALSIIVLTVIIRLLLFPLYMKQLKSTKATQAIQPLMADIKKKYAKDQRAQMEAMQALYKEYGVNPAAGCLPLLVQLPVLYGLFYALNTVLRSPSLTNINHIIYPFLPHFSKLPNVNLDWFAFINPHLVISLGASDPTHILPVLAGVATFIQLRMSQPRSTSTTKDAMSQQMQIMQFVMPFITFFFALQFPAGLALYWTTTSVFSMVQQYFVTGWGSLAVMPDFLAGFLGRNKDTGKSNANGKGYSGDSRKETRLLQKTNVPEATVATKQERTENNSNGRANSYANGSSSTRRRPRNNSASARRRGNAPKRNASRS
jgi:YidC/Oxa1 family membrane protein insertase